MTVEVRTSVIKRRLASINKIIAVASGKGGVGKSMVASNLALALTQKGQRVGLLDLDLYGPSSHIILGVEATGFPEEEKGIIPPKIQGISFMSIVYFSEDKPAAFRGGDISNIILELLAITRWGSLDYLIIDMPPGIGDETLDVLHYIKPSGFLVVTTPSKVALGAVGKLITMLEELKIPILGVVENMVMTRTTLIQKALSKTKIAYLGSLPYDETLEAALGNPDALVKTRFMEELHRIVSQMQL